MAKGAGENGKPATPEDPSPMSDPPDGPDKGEDADDRFLAALQRLVADAELTEEGVAKAIAKLTPDQRRELLEEGRELKQDLLTKSELKDQRGTYKRVMSQQADLADMPSVSDAEFVQKKVSGCPAR